MAKVLMMVAHGGKCCGIKTIYGFPEHGGKFDRKEPRLPPRHTDFGMYHPEYIGLVGAERVQTFQYPGEAPEETTVERLDRYLSNRKPNGIVEVVLTSPNPPKGKNNPVDWPYYRQKESWGPILEERGFVEVSSCHNSNSGNRIHVYHLISDLEKKP